MGHSPPEQWFPCLGKISVGAWGSTPLFKTFGLHETKTKITNSVSSFYVSTYFMTDKKEKEKSGKRIPLKLTGGPGGSNLACIHKGKVH